ncbi:MAG: hypothetical protein KME64_23190 [Scytonematopsis contorta HA4267-MV1]|jgi:hypothetical protein|nr:hypothetical protein [Scytonematopsis contorta HA4267-MV1]
MLRLYHLLLFVILLAVAPVAAKYVFPQQSSNRNSQTQTVKTEPKTSTSTHENIWKSILGKSKTVPTGWSVAPCEGNIPLLCVESSGQRLGTVELGIYSIEKQPNFQKILKKAGVPSGSPVDYEKYQPQVSKALNEWVTDNYATLSKERQNSYGKQVTFSAYPIQKIPVGKLQGVRYGFAGVKQQGGVQEQHFSYAAFDGKALYVISTAFDGASTTGKFEKLENLTTFEPYLSAIVAQLNLPRSK